MYIKYNNDLYVFLNKKEYFKIITRKSNKADEAFYQNLEVYVKQIPPTDTNIQDIFDVHYLIDYDTGLNCVPTTWRVDTSRVEFMDDEVLLVFGQGRLPGWEALENTVCQKCVKLEECGAIRIVFKYKVKDGEECNPPLRIEEELTKDEFRKVFEQYVDENI